MGALFWLSDNQWAAVEPHLPSNQPGARRVGGVGLSSILGAVACGARQIVAVDLSEDKLAFAMRLGATHAVNAGRQTR